MIGVTGVFPVPGEEFVQACDGLIVDLGEDVGEPGLGIDVVELCGDDGGIHVGRTLAAPIGTGEQPGFPAQGDAALCAFGDIVGQADPSVGEEPGKTLRPAQDIGHGCGNGVFFDRRAQLSRIQTSRPSIMGAMLSCRTARRCAGVAPLMARSASKIASILRTASTARGARLSSASLNRPRRACVQQPADMTGAGLRLASNSWL